MCLFGVEKCAQENFVLRCVRKVKQWEKERRKKIYISRSRESRIVSLSPAEREWGGDGEWAKTGR